MARRLLQAELEMVVLQQQLVARGRTRRTRRTGRTRRTSADSDYEMADRAPTGLSVLCLATKTTGSLWQATLGDASISHQVAGDINADARGLASVGPA